MKTAIRNKGRRILSILHDAGQHDDHSLKMAVKYIVNPDSWQYIVIK